MESEQMTLIKNEITKLKELATQSHRSMEGHRVRHEMILRAVMAADKFLQSPDDDSYDILSKSVSAVQHVVNQ